MEIDKGVGQNFTLKKLVSC